MKQTTPNLARKKTTTTNNQKVNKNVLLLSKEEIEGLTYDLRAMPIELYEDEITNLKLIAAQSQDLIGSRLYFGEDGYYYQGLKAKEYSFTKPIKIFSETSMESFTKKVSGTKVILSDYNEYKEWKKENKKLKLYFCLCDINSYTESKRGKQKTKLYYEGSYRKDCFIFLNKETGEWMLVKVE